MQNLLITILLFLSFSLYSQSKETDSLSITYAVQIFSSTDETATINEASTLLDESIIEKVNKNNWRVIVLARSFEEAKKILEIYRESYKDCFIIKYKIKTN